MRQTLFVNQLFHYFVNHRRFKQRYNVKFATPKAMKTVKLISNMSTFLSIVAKEFLNQNNYGMFKMAVSSLNQGDHSGKRIWYAFSQLTVDNIYENKY